MSKPVLIEVSLESNNVWGDTDLMRGMVYAQGGATLRIRQGGFAITFQKSQLEPGHPFHPVIKEMGPFDPGSE